MGKTLERQLQSPHCCTYQNGNAEFIFTSICRTSFQWSMGQTLTQRLRLWSVSSSSDWRSCFQFQTSNRYGAIACIACQEEKVLVCLTQALCVWQLVTFQNKFVLNELLSNIRVMFCTRVGKRDWGTGRLSHYQ